MKATTAMKTLKSHISFFCAIMNLDNIKFYIFDNLLPICESQNADKHN